LMQLVAYGAQDVYLTGNPQITFFKVVYRRHTNFSMEAIEQTWNGTSTSDGRCTATISRNGDLIHKMYIQTEGTGVGANVPDNPGVAWITSVELEIGGQKIDKQSGKWMEVWAELTQPNPTGYVSATAAAANNNVRDTSQSTSFQQTTGYGGVQNRGAVVCRNYTPLQFWFCRNPGLALPLIALQYHEVKVILDHQINNVFNNGNPVTNQLWVDYIYLDTDERRRFAQVSHEYLIEQVQEDSLQLNTNKNELNFNHPVKELIWAGNANNATGRDTSLRSIFVNRAGTGTTNLDTTITLKLNGHDRFAARPSTYFSRTQVYQHHTGPGGLAPNVGAGSALNDSIGVYSFALKPEEHQPSGTCNFSRIDNAQFVTSANLSNETAHIYAVNYNVLRIMSGMGGLAYSN